LVHLFGTPCFHLSNIIFSYTQLQEAKPLGSREHVVGAGALGDSSMKTWVRFGGASLALGTEVLGLNLLC